MDFGLTAEQQLVVWDGTSEIQRHIIGRELLRPLGS